MRALTAVLRSHAPRYRNSRQRRSLDARQQVSLRPLHRRTFRSFRSPGCTRGSPQSRAAARGRRHRFLGESNAAEGPLDCAALWIKNLWFEHDVNDNAGHGNSDVSVLGGRPIVSRLPCRPPPCCPLSRRFGPKKGNTAGICARQGGSARQGATDQVSGCDQRGRSKTAPMKKNTPPAKVAQFATAEFNSCPSTV